VRTLASKGILPLTSEILCYADLLHWVHRDFQPSKLLFNSSTAHSIIEFQANKRSEQKITKNDFAKILHCRSSREGASASSPFILPGLQNAILLVFGIRCLRGVVGRAYLRITILPYTDCLATTWRAWCSGFPYNLGQIPRPIQAQSVDHFPNQ